MKRLFKFFGARKPRPVAETEAINQVQQELLSNVQIKRLAELEEKLTDSDRKSVEQLVSDGIPRRAAVAFVWSNCSPSKALDLMAYQGLLLEAEKSFLFFHISYESSCS